MGFIDRESEYLTFAGWARLSELGVLVYALIVGIMNLTSCRVMSITCMSMAGVLASLSLPFFLRLPLIALLKVKSHSQQIYVLLPTIISALIVWGVTGAKSCPNLVNAPVACLIPMVLFLCAAARNEGNNGGSIARLIRFWDR